MRCFYCVLIYIFGFLKGVGLKVSKVGVWFFIVFCYFLGVGRFLRVGFSLIFCVFIFSIVLGTERVGWCLLSVYSLKIKLVGVNWKISYLRRDRYMFGWLL